MTTSLTPPPELSRSPLSPRQREILGELLRRGLTLPNPNQPKRNQYNPHAPTDKQQVFLSLTCREALYGGAAGGGKSDALLMAALQYVHVPGYAAILFRRTYSDLSLPGALMDRADAWLRPTDAQWQGTDKTWKFPSGATVTFGYLDNEAAKYRYQGAEFQFCGFDELTQFTESQYRYLFSRLRRLQGSEVPLRMRAASNPGGQGHEWVKQRFVTFPEPGCIFVPAGLADNPYLDRAEYEASLAALDPVTRAQLLEGNWDVQDAGGFFKPSQIEVVDAAPAGLRECRAWDIAASQSKGDYTVGAKLATDGDGRFYILDIWRGQWGPDETDANIRQAAALDGRRVAIQLAQDPGAAGKRDAAALVRMLAGYTVQADPVSGSKEVRARAFASQVAAGNVKMVKAAWNAALLSELRTFPLGVNDDQVDACADAFTQLTTPEEASGYVQSNARGHIPNRRTFTR